MQYNIDAAFNRSSPGVQCIHAAISKTLAHNYGYLKAELYATVNILVMHTKAQANADAHKEYDIKPSSHRKDTLKY